MPLNKETKPNQTNHKPPCAQGLEYAKNIHWSYASSLGKGALWV